MEAATVVVSDDIHLTQRIFTVAFGGQAVFHQFDVIFSDAVNCLIDGIDRTVTVGGFCFDFFATGQFDGGGGDIVRARLHAEVIQTEMLRLFLLLTDEGQRLQIVIKHLTFFVRQLQESIVQIV